MNVLSITRWLIVPTLLALIGPLGLKTVIAFQRGPPGVEEGVEVLTRGPVHEAFAGTVTFNPEPGIVAPKAPPDPIEELPPDQRPQGVNVTWVPGYWAWDDERNDFLWVSGIWRDLPPGRQWVPGDWNQSREGFQWTSGYWADARANEIEYLPEPPQSVENGPNVAAHSTDQTWLPGCWVWQQGRYVWRPGYWAAAQPNWVWTPAYYVWAPRGYVFVEGYWDYAVSRRGVLFAPVYFQANVFSRRGFSYSPATVINPAVFVSHLFLRPSYHHYYFGDYYAASYSRSGFYPSYSIHTSRRGYDPIYAHEHWQHRQERDWEQRNHANFQRLRDNEDVRPPRTWSAQKLLRPDTANTAGFTVAAPLEQVIKSTDSALRFTPVNQSERQRLALRGQEVQKYRQERQALETNSGRPTAERPSVAQPARVKFPTSPILSRPDELSTDQAPPRTHEVPKLDTKIEPKPRVLPVQPRPQPGSPPQPGAKLPTTPRVEPPATAPKPQPRVEQPAPKTGPQPRPQPRVERPLAPKPAAAPQPQPQPQPQFKPTAKPTPQPARNERPRPQTKPQAKPTPPQVQPPAPKPQPAAKPPAVQPQGKPPAPPPGSKSDKPKGQEKGKDKN